MYLSINYILFVIALSLLLIVVYRRIIYGTDFLGPLEKRYSTFYRKTQVNNYIRHISRRRVDPQEVILKEVFILFAVLFILFLLGSKAVFFTAVVSGSMSPTFNRDDLVLMQNIDRRYVTGDIIMFFDPLTLRPYTHRIISINERGISTAGDASGLMDPWLLKKEDIIGKAVIFQGKPVLIKGYGKYFIIDDKHQDFGSIFGSDYRKYVLFFQVVKIYGYIIVVFSLLLYIILTARQKPWQNR
ncbi:MAG TPA: signal peptidase I [Candidatus Methanoperedens sp.]